MTARTITDGDIITISYSGIDLKVSNSSKEILNPELVTDMYGISIPPRTTIDGLLSIANNSHVRALQSYANVIAKSMPVERVAEPIIHHVTERILVERPTDVNRLAVYGQISSGLRFIMVLFIITLVICIVSLVAMKPLKLAGR